VPNTKNLPFPINLTLATPMRVVGTKLSSAFLLRWMVFS